MIDRSLFKDHSSELIERIQIKDPDFDIQKLLHLDDQLRLLMHEVEELRHKKNDFAQQGKRGVTPELIQASRDISNLLKEKEKELETIESEFTSLYLLCPNLPAEGVPVGGKEANEVVKNVGSKPNFTFDIKNHVELGEALNWFDFEAAAQMTGSNFVLYKNDAVKLLYSLTQLMIKNNIKHGYELILPPYLVTGNSLKYAGVLPKFNDQQYAIDADGLYLIPTSEVSLTNMYRDKIIDADKLPIRMTSWTSCFRREAGTYGAHERGLIRIHQFEKVELYSICKPEDGAQELDRMLACAEDILKQLDLHYRISLLATQDMSFQAAKTYDIEVWLPGQKAYYEVSSVSLCTDFQSRRSSIRYRVKSGAKPDLVYTLNGSSLALPRLMVAIMETYQKEDGSIEIPHVLKTQGLW